MTWTVNTTERFGGVSRAPRINPYIPARTELFTAGQGAKVSYLDIGKPVVLYNDKVRAAQVNQAAKMADSFQLFKDAKSKT